MSKTLFEKIIAREIPAAIVYEDDSVLAIRDINPQAPTHVLIFPKKVVPRIAEATAADQPLLGHLLLKAAEVADKDGFEKRRLPARHQQRRGRRRNRAAPARPHSRRTPPGLAAGLNSRNLFFFFFFFYFIFFFFFQNHPFTFSNFNQSSPPSSLFSHLPP